MGTNHGPTSMFTSSNTFSIDESKLCFNKTHFNREDFNVERFMNLARQKADLRTIQQDLRLYLKSVQNSMIELINDDYADFVHLSSNLVSLQESLNKIEQDISRNWLDFEDSTKESTGMAERIEKKCDELRSNREKQSEIRDRISYLCAIEKLSDMLRQPPKKCSVLWLQKAATFVVELKSTTASCQHSEEEKNAEATVLTQLEAVLCSEGVRSASTDCRNLPFVLSILTLTESTHSLTAHIVSDLLYAKLVVKKDEKNAEDSNQFNRLEEVYDSVKNMRETWAETLGEEHFCGRVRNFLDETLLTFVLTFIDKCMSNVAVPSDTRVFHKCFLITQNFIETWPSAPNCRTMLKSIRDKFNLLVYFKLETHRYCKKIDQLMHPENLEIEKTANLDDEFYFETTKMISSAIEHVWSDDVYLPPIADKLWDFTLRMLLKHYCWSQATKSYFTEKKIDWIMMVNLRTDTEKLHHEVFNFALESIWGKLHDISVDTAPFGQCLTKHGRSIDDLCEKIDLDIVALFSDVIHQELAQVSDVPKQYRWTKRALPTTNSKYVENSIEMIRNFQNEIEKKDHPDVGKLVKGVSHSAFSYFVEKAKEVQDGVEATGSSLSRFKRKNTPESGSTISDDDKIKRQIYHDGLFLLENAESLNVFPEDITGLKNVVSRFETQKENQKEKPTVQVGAAGKDEFDREDQVNL